MINTPSREEMLNVIYEKIADKTLSFGCRIVQHDHIKKVTYYLGEREDEDSAMGVSIFHTYEFWNEPPRGENHSEYRNDFRGGNENNTIKKIIGHPVMIGDVLDWSEVYEIQEKIVTSLPRGKTYTPITERLRLLRQKKRKPIDDQIYECIEFIYQLVQGE